MIGRVAGAAEIVPNGMQVAGRRHGKAGQAERREGEENGVHYNFTTVEEIKKEIPDSKEKDQIISFIEASEKGIIRGPLQ